MFTRGDDLVVANPPISLLACKQISESVSTMVGYSYALEIAVVGRESEKILEDINYNVSIFKLIK